MQRKLAEWLRPAIKHVWVGFNSHVVTSHGSEVCIPQPTSYLLTTFQTTHTEAAEYHGLFLSSHLSQHLSNAETNDQDVSGLKGDPLVPGDSLDGGNPDTKSAERVVDNIFRVGI